MAATATLNKNNIQGNILAGFNKDFQNFLFVSFPSGGDPKGWIAEIVADVATTSEVESFNALFKKIAERRGEELGTVEASWMNVALSATGLAALGSRPLNSNSSTPPSWQA